MIQGLSSPQDFIIERDFRESLDQTFHFTHEDTGAREAKESIGSQIMPGIGTALGQQPGRSLPTRCMLH